ncbi:MAG: cysteine synthase family protein [Candidatus Bipolaricaulota bacterium]|nr:MAG: cysteine synthase family protein [Candidatus Bipolaricaulota bacterium]
MSSAAAESGAQMLNALVGNTPLLEIQLRYEDEDRILYAKAEHLNMTGSIKDRMALHIIRKACATGDLQPGDRIIEVTSGNTGIAFSAIGRALGHPVTVFMPDWMSPERINLMKSLGAEIVLVSKSEGGFQGSIERAENLAHAEPNSFLPRQFSNNANADAHYVATGPEIHWQLGFRDLHPDAFIAGVGTGGTVMGVGRYLREHCPGIRLHPLEPASSPTLSTGCNVGKHRIQGISDEFVPPILHLDELDDVVAVDDGDAILMAQKLGSELGIAVGISSGANLIGALRVQNQLGREATVVTVFSDDNRKYLSTDLLRFEPSRPRYLSPRVTLLGVRAFKRVCMTCCDPETCVEVASMGRIQGPRLPHCPRRD